MRKRWQLSTSEKQAHLVRVHALIAAGVAIEIDQDLPAQAQMFRIEQSSGGSSSALFARPDGGMGIAIWFTIVALKPEATICGVDITAPWEEAGFYPQECAKNALCYEVLYGPEYPKGSVLNHQLGRRWQAHQRQEGVLIARTSGRLPDFYQSGMVVPITVCFWDQLDTPYSVKAGVGVILDKAAKIPRPTNRGLFEGRKELANEANLIQNPPPAAGDDTNDVFLN